MIRLIKVNNLEKYYGSSNNLVHALKGVTLSINEGDFITIMGASGSGKTTLLNLLSLLDNKTSGDIEINDKIIDTLKQKEKDILRKEYIGFIFQDYNLINSLSVFENIALSLTLIKESNVKQKVLEISKKLEIDNLLKKYPEELSGGQKQRVAIARALVKKPKIVVCDEPTGALDSKNSKNIMKLLKNLNETINITILMVTHESTCAAYSKEVYFMKDGKIYTHISKQNSMSEEQFLSNIDLNIDKSLN